MTRMPEGTKDSIFRVPQRIKNGLRILATTSLLAACTPEPTQPPIGATDMPGSTNPAFTQTVPGMGTPSPTEFQPTLTPSGPETTPISPRPYPGSLTVETANAGMASVVDAPASITGLADVQAIMAKHTQLARDAGLSFDHMAVKYVSGEQRWFLVPVQSDGTTIAGWLEIADPTSQSGWRFGEQPTWDSQYHPSTDTYQYGLPALHDAANHFELGFANGFPILIEVTADGSPQYWNNIAQKTTMLVEGALLPTVTPTPEATVIPFESGPSLEFSPLFPAEWHKEWTGHVNGMDIPIIIGLSDGVVHDTTDPITPIYGVWMTQDGVNDIEDWFLRAAHYRYTKIMGNAVTYEEYLELLKQPTGGEVLLLITDNNGARREAWINPRQGFSLLIAEEIDTKLGVHFGPRVNGFFGVDGQGRLLIATNQFSLITSFPSFILYGVETQDNSFLCQNFGYLNYFGIIENKCMASGNSMSTCGDLHSVMMTLDFWHQLRVKQEEMVANKQIQYDFGLVKP